MAEIVDIAWKVDENMLEDLKKYLLGMSVPLVTDQDGVRKQELRIREEDSGEGSIDAIQLTHIDALTMMWVKRLK